MIFYETHLVATRAKATDPHIPPMINVIVLKSVVGVLVISICVEIVDLLAVVLICVNVGPAKKSRGLNNTLRNCDGGLH